MVTYAQLQAESWWGREVVTPELDWLGSELCRRTGRPRTAFGHKGNDRHLNGGHRSQEWIKNSRFCTNRSYTVQSGLTATQMRHIAAADFTPGVWGTSANRQLMVAQTRRLVAAMKAGRLPGVREVIGTLDGKTVTGTRADGSTFSSDSSHLDHWHLTLDRRYCADRSLMERIVAVALGEDNDMPLSNDDLGKIRSQVALGLYDALWVAANGKDFRDLRYSGSGSIGASIQANLGTLTAAPMREELAALPERTADAVMERLGGQSPAEAAQALVSTLGRDRAAALASALTAAVGA